MASVSRRSERVGEGEEASEFRACPSRPAGHTLVVAPRCSMAAAANPQRPHSAAASSLALDPGRESPRPASTTATPVQARGGESSDANDQARALTAASVTLSSSWRRASTRHAPRTPRIAGPRDDLGRRHLLSRVANRRVANSRRSPRRCAHHHQVPKGSTTAPACLRHATDALTTPPRTHPSNTNSLDGEVGLGRTERSAPPFHGNGIGVDPPTNWNGLASSEHARRYVAWREVPSTHSKPRNADQHLRGPLRTAGCSPGEVRPGEKCAKYAVGGRPAAVVSAGRPARYGPRWVRQVDCLDRGLTQTGTCSPSSSSRALRCGQRRVFSPCLLPSLQGVGGFDLHRVPVQVSDEPTAAGRLQRRRPTRRFPIGCSSGRPSSWPPSSLG